MALALRNAAPLKAQVRLAQAVSEFEASLNTEHKASFRNARITTKTTPPTPSDVMRLTAEIDYRVRQEHGPSRCFGPRLTNILQAVQQFAALGDTVVGGSQNLVACGVWSAVRMMLHMAIGYASYLEKLSLLFMTAGRQAPRYQALAILYPQSKTLQRCLSEYFIVIVRICQRVQQYAKKSAFGQFKSSLTDADLREDQADLELWGNSIKDKASLLLNRRVHDESQENKKARAWVSRWSASSSQQYALERKVRLLDACSTYDFQTTWKQIRKRGSTSLLVSWAEYQQWKQHDTTSAILFSGKVGAGKSVTLANIVDDLFLARNTTIVYFFCRHDIPESLKSRTILGSLARQYLSYLPENDDIFDESPSALDLDIITALLKSKGDNRKRYILIDGLDECSAEERRIALTQISWLQTNSNWRLGFSARFSAEGFIGQHINLKWHVSMPTNNPDIDQYITSELDSRLSSGQLVLGDPNLVSEIRAALLGGANGMFLWVALQLDQICSEVSDHAIRLSIKSLPRDLSETYARILSSSSAKDFHQYHIRLFKFLVAAYVPLTIDQIHEMASVTIADATWDPSKQINNILKVIGFCGSLVMIDEEEHVVRFVHHSARSFCQGVLGDSNHWQFCFSDDEAHREVGETAVTYLSYSIFDRRLSTRVIPKVDVGEVTERILHATLGTPNPLAHLALNVIRPNQNGNRDIGQLLAHAHEETIARELRKTDHPFLPYAKKFWMFHTTNMENSAVHNLWVRLFNEVDVNDLQFTPHLVGPLDTFEAPCEHPFASAFTWAVNYSHVAVFDRLMESSSGNSSSTKLPWARFRLFRSLLQHLHPDHSISKLQLLKRGMVDRLLPLATVLRVDRAVESMLPCADPKEAIRAFEVAVSCGNYKSAAIILSNPAFSHPKKHFLPTKLLITAASAQDARMICLVAKTSVARSADTNAMALWSALRSDMQRESLLRVVFVLMNVGVRPEKFMLSSLHPEDMFASVQLLATSPEINSEMALQAIARLLVVNSDIPGFHEVIFRQACSLGNFELARSTWLSYFDCRAPMLELSSTSSFPFRGDEMALALQKMSKSAVKLLEWLLSRGFHQKDEHLYRKVIMVREWQLNDSLTAGRGFPTDVLSLCTDQELLHACVLVGDLVGVDFLLKIGADFNTPSLGPMFTNETCMQALTTQDTDYFDRCSISELYIRGGFSLRYTSARFTGLETVMRRFLLSDSPFTWYPEIRHIVREARRHGISPDEYSWFICIFAASLRKAVRARLTYSTSSNRGFTGSYLQDWLGLLEEICHSDMDLPGCNKQEGLLAIREVFGILAEMDEAIMPSRSRWLTQMELWRFIDLFVDHNARSSSRELSRNNLLQELSVLVCKRSLSLDDVSQKTLYGSSCATDRVYEALRLADVNRDLPWILQYLLMRSMDVNVADFCSYSVGLAFMVRGTGSSRETRNALKLVGWTDLEVLEWSAGYGEWYHEESSLGESDSEEMKFEESKPFQPSQLSRTLRSKFRSRDHSRSQKS